MAVINDDEGKREAKIQNSDLIGTVVPDFRGFSGDTYQHTYCIYPYWFQRKSSSRMTDRHSTILSPQEHVSQRDNGTFVFPRRIKVKNLFWERG